MAHFIAKAMIAFGALSTAQHLPGASDVENKRDVKSDKMKLAGEIIQDFQAFSARKRASTKEMTDSQNGLLANAVETSSNGKTLQHEQDRNVSSPKSAKDMKRKRDLNLAKEIMTSSLIKRSRAMMRESSSDQAQARFFTVGDAGG